MGRALSRYVPLDTAILSLIEFALSLTVIHYMLLTPTTSGSAVNARGHDLAAILALVIGGVTLITGIRRPELRLDRRRLLATAAIAGIILCPLFLLISAGFVQGGTAARMLWLSRILGVWLATIMGFRLLFSFALRQTLVPRRVIILGEPARIQAVNARLASRRGRRFQLLVIEAETLSWELLRQQRVWSIVVAAAAEQPMSARLLEYKLRGMKVLSHAAFQERHLGRLDPDELTVKDLLLAEGFACGRLADGVKRGCDIVIGVALLLMTTSMMVVTALAIKLDSPGPVLYRQQRIGLHGRPFTLLKFRSMTINAEPAGKPRWAQKQDSRITKVGAFLRAARIDELPQLANIIGGEMSLVGPRPERPQFVEQLARAIPFYRVRSYVKPGLTGWAQVNFPYGASVEDAREKLAYDLFYAKHHGLRLDLFILILTVRVVLLREGAR